MKNSPEFRTKRRAISIAVVCLLVVVFASRHWTAAQTLPRPDHIVIVVEENRSYGRIKDFMKEHQDSYLRELVNRGASFEKFFAYYHPSQPNYILLFSGDNQQIVNDDKPAGHFSAKSLGGALKDKCLTFAGYSEDLPSIGFDGAESGLYVRKHAPWTNFDDVRAEWNLPLSSFPKTPEGFAKLPTISFVTPNLENDMHGKDLVQIIFSKPLIKKGDDWLRATLKDYAEWAMVHNSLLIVTWDESHKQFTESHYTPPEKNQNRIATVFFGQMVEPNTRSKQVHTHLDLLRTLEEMYGLELLGLTTDSSKARVIDEIWRPKAFWKMPVEEGKKCAN